MITDGPGAQSDSPSVRIAHGAPARVKVDPGEIGEGRGSLFQFIQKPQQHYDERHLHGSKLIQDELGRAPEANLDSGCSHGEVQNNGTCKVKVDPGGVEEGGGGEFALRLQPQQHCEGLHLRVSKVIPDELGMASEANLDPGCSHSNILNNGTCTCHN